MNGKKARKCRQKARVLTVGMVNTSYSRDSKTGALVLDENCTRAVYKKLKRAYRNSKQNKV